MKLSQKRNCNGCKASTSHSRPCTHTCQYQVEVKTVDYTGIPQSPCYKPMTNKQWSEAFRIVFPR